MKVENPLGLALVALVVVAGIFFLSQEKATPLPALGNDVSMMSEKQGKYPSAPELTGIAGYLNADETFTLSSQKGKVVLVDFWTYSCINCIRTQPYLNAWHEKYADKGLVIIGVHTPEFGFEEEYDNVKAAVEKAGIQYPVVMDNDYLTWRAYKNQYWPRKYLIDADGFIRYDHIGEGAYEETEEQIQLLLKERDEKLVLSESVSTMVEAQTPDTDFSKIQTPEIYLGYAFARAPLANPENYQPDQTVEYSLPETLPPNLVALAGTWKNTPDYMELVSDAGKVSLYYSAKNVNIVAAQPAHITVTLDGSIIQDALPIEEEKLYSVVEEDAYAPHTLTLDIEGKGFRLYTFTFG